MIELRFLCCECGSGLAARAEVPTSLDQSIIEIKVELCRHCVERLIERVREEREIPKEQ